MSAFFVHPVFIGSISNQLLREFNKDCDSDVEDLVFFTFILRCVSFVFYIRSVKLFS